MLYSPRSLQDSRKRQISRWLNPNVANLHREKPLRSCDSTPSVTVLAADRTSRKVKYASTCPSLCAATSDALLRVFPRHRLATLRLKVIVSGCGNLYIIMTRRKFSKAFTAFTCLGTRFYHCLLWAFHVSFAKPQTRSSNHVCTEEKMFIL